MNRLRVLKQRAARAKIGICKFDDGYVVAHGYGWGEYSTTMSRREAILLASRWALPWKRYPITITVGDSEKGFRETLVGYTEVNW